VSVREGGGRSGGGGCSSTAKAERTCSPLSLAWLAAKVGISTLQISDSVLAPGFLSQVVRGDFLPHDCVCIEALSPDPSVWPISQSFPASPTPFVASSARREVYPRSTFPRSVSHVCCRALYCRALYCCCCCSSFFPGFPGWHLIEQHDDQTVATFCIRLVLACKLVNPSSPSPGTPHHHHHPKPPCAPSRNRVPTIY
jgi:hypothetical protein